MLFVDSKKPTNWPCDIQGKKTNRKTKDIAFLAGEYWDDIKKVTPSYLKSPFWHLLKDLKKRSSYFVSGCKSLGKKLKYWEVGSNYENRPLNAK